MEPSQLIYLASLLVWILTFNPTTSIERNQSLTFYLDLSKLTEKHDQDIGAKMIVDKENQNIKSFCVIFYFSKSSGKQFPFFVSKPSTNTFRFYFNFKTNYGKVTYNTKDLIFKIPYKPTPFQYLHFCFSHNDTNYMVAANGLLWYKTKIQKTDLASVREKIDIGEIRFGPIPDKTDKRSVSFTGRISELNIFSDSFTEDELVSFSENCERIDVSNGKVLNWHEVSSSNIIIDKDVTIGKDSMLDICFTRKTDHVDVLPYAMDFQEASDACISLGGSMYLPKSLDGIKIVAERARKTAAMRKLTETSCQEYFWLPLIKTPDLSKWVEFTNQSHEAEVSYTIGVDGQDFQYCACYNLVNYINDKMCSSKYCAACTWTTQESFTIRGLCSQSLIETQYVLIQDFHHNGILGKVNENLVALRHKLHHILNLFSILWVFK